MAQWHIKISTFVYFYKISNVQFQISYDIIEIETLTKGLERTIGFG